eukprot:TRINITY_DN4061_c0_g1_i1.p1 TRINITY_DN4061_c0_g1~~TRINITY_DN4061_c0_g1_i1.p1  ORF type:complete len:501 (+),score=163.27 TRINITY_DN4061_c0_g1_i1:92-1594(+)
MTIGIVSNHHDDDESKNNHADSSEDHTDVSRSFLSFVKSEHLAESMANFNEFKRLCLENNADKKELSCLSLSDFLESQTPASNYLVKRIWETIRHKKESSEYKGRKTLDTRVVIVGAGLAGLRTAIECSLMGCERVTVIEKREEFSRLNILHLWPFVIQDLRALGAKEFWSKFAIGGHDCAPIWQLQMILVKIALLLGVQVVLSTEYVSSAPSTENQFWIAKTEPPLQDPTFNVLIGAEGERSRVAEEFQFKQKVIEFSSAIGITANFEIVHCPEENKMQEGGFISYLHRDFFSKLNDENNILLENLVYYRSDTHYFVMTAAKKSLLANGVLKEDLHDNLAIVNIDNINTTALAAFVRTVSEAYGLPSQCKFVQLGGTREDVCLFDFSKKHAADDPSQIVEKEGKKIFVSLVGDAALNPFWPQGTGAGHACLSSLDAAWCIQKIREELGKQNPDDGVLKEALEEHHRAYKLMESAKCEQIKSKDCTSDPSSRYMTYSVIV